MMATVLFIGFYVLIPPSVTLTLFEGHSIVKQLNTEIIILLPMSLPDQVQTLYDT